MLVPAALAQQGFIAYSKDLVHVFPNLRGKSTLYAYVPKTETDRDSLGPPPEFTEGPTFLSGSVGLVFWDASQRRIATFGNDWKLNRAIALPEEYVLRTYQCGDFFYLYGNNVALYSVSGKRVWSISKDRMQEKPGLPVDYPQWLFQVGNFLICRDWSNRLGAFAATSHGIETPEIMDRQGTLALFDAGRELSRSGFWIDSEDRLLENDEMVETDYEGFKSWISEKYNGVVLSDKMAKRGLDLSNFNIIGGPLGRDKLGNWYWGSTRRIVIMSPEGKVLDAITVQTSDSQIGSIQVFPNGDIYCLDLKDAAHSGFRLYRIKNVWAPIK